MALASKTLNASGALVGFGGNKFDSAQFLEDLLDEVNSLRAAVASAAVWSSGTGSPENAVTGNKGDLFSRTDGGAATCLYVKESTGGNTGWKAVTTS